MSLNWTIEQMKSWIDATFPDNVARSITEADLRDVLKKTADFVFETNSSGIIRNALVETLNARDQTIQERILAQQAVANAALGQNPLGEYNAATNIPALSATPPSENSAGSYYDITVEGAAAFAGSNFASATVLAVGGRLIKKDNTKWFYQPPSNLALTKVIGLEDKLGGIVYEGDVKLVDGGEVYSVLSQYANVERYISFELHPGQISSGGNPDTGINWLRTAKIPCSPATAYTIAGMGTGHSVLSTHRVFFYNNNAFLNYIGSSGSKVTFETPINCTHFMVQVEALSGSASDIPNSPFWLSLKIIQAATLNGSYLRAEAIKGHMGTAQIVNLEQSSASFERTFTEILEHRYNVVPIITANGAIKANSGILITAADYFRTSISSIPSMATVVAGRVYTYTGTIEENSPSVAGVSFRDENLAHIASACVTPGVYVRQKLVPPAGTKYIAACSKYLAPVIEERITTAKARQSLTQYIDVSYSGESDGSELKPHKSFTEAINSVNGSADFIVTGGDYRETIPLAALNDGKYSFSARMGERVRILGSNKLSGWVKTDGYTNVYETAFSGAIPSGSRLGKRVFEDGKPSRPILDDERHPLQKGASFRLPFSTFTEVGSIALTDATAGKFFHDTVAGVLYIHTTDSSNPETNGCTYEIMTRNFNTSLPAKTKKKVEVGFYGLQFYFGISGLRFLGYSAVRRENVTVMAVNGDAIVDDCSNVIAYNDEAAYANNDGINGHFSSWPGFSALTDHRSMQPVCIYFDPWTHDNFDDGMSHHENHRVVVHGILAEYNDDGGIRASNDANYTVYAGYSRKNGLVTGEGEGFAVVNPTVNPNRNGCKMTLFSCFSEGNSRGYASISDSRNLIELINCVGRNNTVAELFCSAGKIISRNTLATNSNPTKLKSISGSGQIQILNDSIVA